MFLSCEFVRLQISKTILRTTRLFVCSRILNHLNALDADIKSIKPLKETRYHSPREKNPIIYILCFCIGTHQKQICNFTATASSRGSSRPHRAVLCAASSGRKSFSLVSQAHFMHAHANTQPPLVRVLRSGVCETAFLAFFAGNNFRDE